MLPGRMSLRLKNRMSDVDEACNAFRSFAEEHRMPARTQSDLLIAVDELVSNVVKYAWDDEAEHEIELEVELTRREVVLAVSDDGKPYDAFAREDPDLTLPLEDRPIGGLGIHIVRRLTNEQRYQRLAGRNRLTIRRTLSDDEA